MKLHKVLIASSLLQGFGLLATMLLGIQLARYLGPTRYGVYGLIMAVVTIVVVVAKFGLPLLAMREAAHANINFKSLLKWFFLRSAGISAGVSIALAVSFYSFGPKWIRGNIGLVALPAIFVAASAMLSCFVGIVRGVGRNLYGQFVELLLWPTLVVLGVWFLHTDGELTLNEVFYCQITALLLCFVLAMMSLVKLAKIQKSTIASFSVTGWAATCATFMVNNLLGALSASYPMIVAGFFVTGSGLGVLRVALASASLLALPSSIANIATVPIVARELAIKDLDARDRSLSHTTLACFSLTASGLIFFAIFGQSLIVILFGRVYSQAYPVLLVLGIGHLIIAAFGIAGSYLSLVGRERLVTKAFLISVPCGLLVSLVSAKYFGIVGAAAGTVVMAAVWHLFVFGFRGREVDAPVSLFKAFAHVWSSPKCP